MIVNMVVYNVNLKDKKKIDKFMDKLKIEQLNSPQFTYYGSTSY